MLYFNFFNWCWFYFSFQQAWWQLISMWTDWNREHYFWLINSFFFILHLTHSFLFDIIHIGNCLQWRTEAGSFFFYFWYVILSFGHLSVLDLHADIAKWFIRLTKLDWLLINILIQLNLRRFVLFIFVVCWWYTSLWKLLMFLQLIQICC